MKAQVSVEYMMVVGFVVVLTMPLLIIYYTYTGNMNDDITSSQIDKVSKRIVDAAESVYYLGEPSQTVVKVYLPQGVEEVIITGREINYKVSTRAGITDMVTISAANLTGTLPEGQGTYFVTVKSIGDKVELSYK